MQSIKIKKPEIHDDHREFYGETLAIIEEELHKMSAEIERLEILEEDLARKRIEHFKWRIKKPNSIQDKLKRNGKNTDLDTALTELYDYAGIRIVCAFLEDVYSIRDYFESMKGVTIIEEKDYVKFPKPNGYRSFHMILEMNRKLKENVPKMHMEIQIRTISQDSWASLEHQLKYKQKVQHSEMIVEELKRCADELASTDLTMQTIRDWIDGKIEEEI